MTTTHAAAAKAIRKELKANGITARVRSSVYAGGSSINIRIEQDLMPAAVAEVESFCKRFQYGHFDGMTDSYEYSNSREDLPQVKFVFVEVVYSDEIKAAAKDYIANIDGIDEFDRDRYAYMALRGRYGDFWTSRKPRIRAA